MTRVRTIARDRVDQLGEGPLWSVRENALYWTDILSHRLHRLSLADDRIESWEFEDYLGWVIERDRGGLVAGLGREVVALDLASGAIAPIAAPEPDRDGNRLNDAKADRLGRIWAGTMPVNADRPTGGFYRIDTDGSVSLADDGYRIANGPAISADGSFLLHTDTGARTIYRFDIHDDGRLGPRSPFITFESQWGNPDGMTFDAESCLWVACWGAGCVARFTPDGRYERNIALPASQITSCTFAGADLDRMFVTSAAVDVDEAEGGALFEVDPGCRGLPTHVFRG